MEQMAEGISDVSKYKKEVGPDKKRNSLVDDVVMMKIENSQRGRVSKTFPGQDGMVWSVRLKVLNEDEVETRETRFLVAAGEKVDSRLVSLFNCCVCDTFMNSRSWCLLIIIAYGQGNWLLEPDEMAN